MPRCVRRCGIKLPGNVAYPVVEIRHYAAVSGLPLQPEGVAAVCKPVGHGGACAVFILYVDLIVGCGRSGALAEVGHLF